MSNVPSNLCTLVEQLEDSRRFHDDEAQNSIGARRAYHHEKSQSYAAMLTEIRQWEALAARCDDVPDFIEASNSPGHTHAGDSYAALLNRIVRMHRALTAAKPSAGEAMDSLRLTA